MLKKLNFRDLALLSQKNIGISEIDLILNLNLQEEIPSIKEKEKLKFRVVDEVITLETIIHKKVFKIKTIRKLKKGRTWQLDLSLLKQEQKYFFDFGGNWIFEGTVEGTSMIRGKKFLILKERLGQLLGFEIQKGQVKGLEKASL